MKYLDKLTEFLELLFSYLGPQNTVLLVLGIAVLVVGWRLYQDHQRDKYIKKLLAEKDQTIQRLSNEARGYKTLWFKMKEGISPEELDSIFHKNDYLNPADARKKMEDGESTKSENEN